MSTYPPTMTTEQLIETCQRAGVSVSPAQLSRWVRVGLIPDSLRRQRGRGRGKGAEWFWQIECAWRCVIISQALGEGDKSFLRAAEALARAGYAPSATWLRRILMSCLDGLLAQLTQRQSYLGNETIPVREKQGRLRKTLRRKRQTVPNAVVDLVATIVSGFLGLTGDSATTTSFVAMFSQASLPAMRQRIATCDDTTIIRRYEETGHLLPDALYKVVAALDSLRPFLALLESSEQERTIMLTTPFVAENILGGMHCLAGDSASKRIIVTPEHPAGHLRIFLALLAAGTSDAYDKLLPVQIEDGVKTILSLIPPALPDMPPQH